MQGFPTIKLITAGKNGKRKVVDFKGGRTAKDIVEWALGQAKKIALNRIGITAGMSSVCNPAYPQLPNLRKPPRTLPQEYCDSVPL